MPPDCQKSQSRVVIELCVDSGGGQSGQQPSETDLQALLRQAASNPGLLQGAPLEQLLQNAASNSVLQTRQLTGEMSNAA